MRISQGRVRLLDHGADTRLRKGLLGPFFCTDGRPDFIGQSAQPGHQYPLHWSHRQYAQQGASTELHLLLISILILPAFLLNFR